MSTSPHTQQSWAWGDKCEFIASPESSGRSNLKGGDCFVARNRNKGLLAMTSGEMTREEILKDLQDRFKDDIIDFFDKSTKRVYIEIKPASIVNMASYIFKDLGARFNTASGIDARHHMEILYHFIIEEINLLISLQVKLPKSKLEIDSLTSVFKGANWIEREIYELLGINFRGHPDLRRLLLSEEWPPDAYPLRRDYKEWDKKAIRDRGV